MQPAGSLAVVVVTYNSLSVLPRLLDSLAAGLQGLDDFRVIVVDNNSADGSAELAERHPIAPTVIRMGRNAGYAAGINAAAGIVACDADLLILNPDLRLYRGAVRPLLERAATSSVGIVVPRSFNEDGSTNQTIRREPSVLSAWAEAILGGGVAGRLGWGEVVGPLERYDKCQRIEWASGSSLLVSARAREAVGDWDEFFFLYSEEVDYQWRVRRAGFDIIYEPQSKVVHTGGDSHNDPRLFALLTANRIRYYRRRHGPFQTWFFRLGIALGEAARLWRGPVHRAGLRIALSSLT